MLVFDDDLWSMTQSHVRTTRHARPLETSSVQANRRVLIPCRTGSFQKSEHWPRKAFGVESLQLELSISSLLPLCISSSTLDDWWWKKMREVGNLWWRFVVVYFLQNFRTCSGACWDANRFYRQCSRVGDEAYSTVSSNVSMKTKPNEKGEAEFARRSPFHHHPHHYCYRWREDFSTWYRNEVSQDKQTKPHGNSLGNGLSSNGR